MTILSPYLSIITLNVNGLNSPIRRHRVSEWIKKKQDPNMCCLQEIHFICKDTHGWTVKEQKPNGNQTRVEVTILVSDKIDFN